MTLSAMPLPSEHSDVIWVRKLLPGSVITVILYGLQLRILYKRQPSFIFNSWLRTSVYYNAPFERWHKSE